MADYPSRRRARAVFAVAAAADTKRGRKPTYKELLERVKDQEAELARRDAQIAELKKEKGQWERVAKTDALTGALNRYGAELRFDELIANVRANGYKIGVIAFDLDKFKAVNDLLGHDVGDEVLKIVGDVVREHVRGGPHVMSRPGGDEHLIVLERPRDKQTIEVIAKRLREEIERALKPISDQLNDVARKVAKNDTQRLRDALRHDHDGQPLNVTASFGGVFFDPHENAIAVQSMTDKQLKDWLSKLADQAASEAKAAGRNCERIVHANQLAEPKRQAGRQATRQARRLKT